MINPFVIARLTRVTRHTWAGDNSVREVNIPHHFSTCFLAKTNARSVTPTAARILYLSGCLCPSLSRSLCLSLCLSSLCLSFYFSLLLLVCVPHFSSPLSRSIGYNTSICLSLTSVLFLS